MGYILLEEVFFCECVWCVKLLVPQSRSPSRQGKRGVRMKQVMRGCEDRREGLKSGDYKTRIQVGVWMCVCNGGGGGRISEESLPILMSTLMNY